MTRTGKRIKAGLTLVEVMLAITILSIGLVVLIASAGRAVAVAKKSKEYETARKLMADVALNEPLQLDDLEEGSDHGTFPSPYRDYKWQRDVIVKWVEEDEIFEIRTLLHLASAQKNGFIHEDAEGRRLDEK